MKEAFFSVALERQKKKTQNRTACINPAKDFESTTLLKKNSVKPSSLSTLKYSRWTEIFIGINCGLSCTGLTREDEIDLIDLLPQNNPYWKALTKPERREGTLASFGPTLIIFRSIWPPSVEQSVESYRRSLVV